jgi:hypothetical protein
MSEIIGGLLVTWPARFTPPQLVRGERRAFPRLPAHQLHWLTHVALDVTPAVSIIDLSAHGALVEVDVPVRPGQPTQFELYGDEMRACVSAHVLRTEVSALQLDAVRYRSACVFSAPLPWTHRLAPASRGVPTINIPPPYAPSDAWSELRATFLHGRTVEGYACHFEPACGYVDVWPRCDASERRQTLPLSLIRKLVFVRGMGADGVAQAIAAPPAGCLQPVDVTFRNNDVVSGSALGYRETDGGLWVFPPRTHAAVFAVAAAVREIRFF